jgi:cytochrome c2
MAGIAATRYIVSLRWIPSYQCSITVRHGQACVKENTVIKLSVAVAAVGLVLLILSALPGTASSTQAAATSVPPTAAAAETADAAYGKALFLAKGCATCHHHAAVAGSGNLGEGVPDLTTYRWNADYLRSWLKDPSAVKPGTYMPTLDLKQDEIEAMIAFLSQSKG